MGEKERPEQTVDPEQTVRLRIDLLGPLPPWRVVYDQSQHDEYHRQQRKHAARFIEHKERISNDDARKLVGLWLDLDPLWEDPEIAHNYMKWWLGISFLDSDKTPLEEAIEACAEKARTSALHWDALAWAFAHIDGDRPLGKALQRWVGDVIHGRCPCPSQASKMGVRNDVLRWAVYILTECGMNATRNEATDEMERPSACDIVLGVLKERNHSVSSYNTMRDIWRGKR